MLVFQATVFNFLKKIINFHLIAEYLAMSDKKTVYIWKISYKRGFRVYFFKEIFKKNYKNIGKIGN